MAVESGFKTLLIKNLASDKSPHANCEHDAGQLLTLSSFMLGSADQEAEFEDSPWDAENENDLIPDFSNLPSAKDLPESIAVKIIKKVKRRTVIKDCHDCQSQLESRTCLVRLSDSVAQINSVIWKVGFRRRLRQQLKTWIRYDFQDIRCDEHATLLQEQLLHDTLVISIQEWCNEMNSIMMGKNQSPAESNIMIAQALKQSMKWRRKPKIDLKSNSSTSHAKPV